MQFAEDVLTAGDTVFAGQLYLVPFLHQEFMGQFEHPLMASPSYPRLQTHLEMSPERALEELCCGQEWGTPAEHHVSASHGMHATMPGGCV